MSLIEHFRELWRYRVLIENLVRRDVSLRYRGSVLGYLWTLLNPLSVCITPENPQRFSGMVSADALDLVLYEINLVESARRVG